MIEINIQGDIEGLNIDTDALLRTIATSVLSEIRVRVHKNGKASDGSQIGTYSDGYLVYRSGQFKNATVNTKGKLTSTGFYTKGKKAVFNIESKKAVKVKESKRKAVNRGSDSKVILSLTRQMEGDMRVIQEGEFYCIGFSNDTNYNKAIWNEQRYKKQIWNLSKEEHTIKSEIISDFVNNAINDRKNK